MIELDRLYNEDCLDLLPKIEDSSIDVVLTDPPFLYLKNQKLERPFDENRFFSEIKRILKDDGFLVFFGRGESFYRWNYIVSRMNLVFKEEVIWHKNKITSPVLPLGRCHETIAIWTKAKGKIRRCYIGYTEKKQDINSVIGDINRLRVVLNNPKELELAQMYLQTGEKVYSPDEKISKFKTSIQNTGSSSRVQNVLEQMRRGSLESSVMTVVKNSYKAIHPTEKPVRLLERLLCLVSDVGGVVLDPFAGSASTCLAAKHLGRHYIGVEIDREYFELALDRISEFLL